jgi:integrase
MFEAAEIRAMLEKATQPLKAMIYLGINCAFGNNDCGTLPLSKLDLENGWHTYGRPKTHTKRECPLWPETVEAIKAALAERPEPASSDLEGLVFLTHTGQCWSKESGDNALSSEFRKLLKELGIYRPWITSFYSLRRTVETIGATAGEQIALDFIMGHLRDDMASVYRQKQFREPLLKVTNHVRDWLTGQKKIE